MTIHKVEAAEVQTFTSTSSVAAYIKTTAIARNINSDLALFIADKESQFVATSTGDMNLVCPQGVNKGKPVRARGVFQITECYHPEVSDACAYNVACATDIALPMIRDNCLKEFSTCKLYKKRVAP